MQLMMGGTGPFYKCKLTAAPFLGQITIICKFIISDI